MSLTAENVNKIAYLARLGINEQDVDAYAKDLSGILALVEQMNEINTDDVVPMAHPLDQAQRLRPDIITEQDQHTLFQAQAPQVEADLYLVPKVIE
jgi:aspartyl-tRNA(Asn)/glutamyl-tRNA(Gln) amidotransferase subunit C